MLCGIPYKRLRNTLTYLLKCNENTLFILDLTVSQGHWRCLFLVSFSGYVCQIKLNTQRIRGIAHYALYKSTYLLTYLLSFLVHVKLYYRILNVAWSNNTLNYATKIIIWMHIYNISVKMLWYKISFTWRLNSPSLAHKLYTVFLLMSQQYSKICWTFLVPPIFDLCEKFVKERLLLYLSDSHPSNSICPHLSSVIWSGARANIARTALYCSRLLCSILYHLNSSQVFYSLPDFASCHSLGSLTVLRRLCICIHCLILYVHAVVLW